jgi:chemotaxis protein histidine kinase CheA
MAAREGQGLQITVIVFAMLTIGLAIMTYVFYAQAQSAGKEKESAVKQRGEETAKNNKLEYQVTAMKYMLGMPNVTKQEVELAAGKAGKDADVEAMLAKFDADVAAIGDQAAPDEAKNYGTLAKILLASLQKAKASVADANEQTRKAQAEKAAAEAREQQRSKAAEDALAKAKADLDEQTKKFNEDRTRMEGESSKFVSLNTDREKKAKVDIDTLVKDKEKLINQITQQQATIQRLQERLKEYQKEEVSLFENPDGRITWVNQKQKLVWINLGRADGLLRSTTFRVYDHDENGVANAEPKGSIEVVQISGDHLAEARIIQDKTANPILPNDLVHTPAWSPGQRVHFALAGAMDIDGDGRATTEEYNRLRGIIELNGGKIDAELRPDGTRMGTMTISTRYFVMGQIDAENAPPKMLTELTNMQNERQRYGIDIIPVEKLLSLMGWRAEERTVPLAGNTSGDFRKRAPAGKAAPPPGGTPPTSSTTTTPAEGAAPAEEKPAAPADPFAAPAAPAAPAAAPDPFAPPK